MVGQLTATDIYNIREGVCHHFTKLYNALLYSLGYIALYVRGYAIEKKNVYGEEDGYAWSVVKINGNWLPFDATWGIFSGNLPICHVFKSLSSNQYRVTSIDSIKL